MVDHGQYDFAYRAIGNDVHDPAWRDQCRSYLFFFGDPGDADLRTFRLRLGLSHCGVAGLLRVAVKEDWPGSQTVSIAIAGLCSACRRSLYVCFSDGFAGLHEAGGGTANPGIYESPGNE